jgi:hypothetical protein
MAPDSEVRAHQSDRTNGGISGAQTQEFTLVPVCPLERFLHVGDGCKATYYDYNKLTTKGRNDADNQDKSIAGLSRL